MYRTNLPPFLAGSAAGDGPDDEKRLCPRRDRVGKRGIWGVVGQVPLARKDSQERPSLRGDVVADRPSEHGIAGLERVEHCASSDPPQNVELHLAFDLGQRPQVWRQHHADHGSRWTSTDSTAGRSRTIGAPLSPASAHADTCPPVGPQYTPPGAREATALASRRTVT